MEPASTLPQADVPQGSQPTQVLAILPAEELSISPFCPFPCLASVHTLIISHQELPNSLPSKPSAGPCNVMLVEAGLVTFLPENLPHLPLGPG